LTPFFTHLTQAEVGGRDIGGGGAFSGGVALSVNGWIDIHWIHLRTVEDSATRDRCYDFKNIFAEKFCEKIGVFDSEQS
jgi:hypothetical protein